ncbi:MAG: FAD-binding oxidoreductase [Candidatus Obscuribacterales bacterium]|nr:FAD-binding oxidoreductase [Candidatus Obscuribacterales bacterium]
MSSSEALNPTAGKSSVLATFEHAGNLIEHISCPSSSALVEHIQKCKREDRKIIPGRPVKLPASPSKRISYFLSIDGADKIIEHCRPDQVISVEAGISIANLNKFLAEHKQWFPVYVPDESISLMEYINRGSSGSLEHGYGEARDLVLGMQVALGSGELIRCGGKVVKNVTGYDLPKVFTGAHGTMCIPFSAHLRLFALPETSNTVVLPFNKIADAFKTVRKLSRSGLPVSCLEIVDTEIFDLQENSDIKETLLSLSQEKILLIVQVHGNETVVSELKKEISRASEKEFFQSDKLSAEREKQLWNYLAQPSAFSTTPWLEIAGASQNLETLISELKEKYPSISWAARPTRNKASLSLTADIELHEIIDALNSSCKNRAQSATIAYADDSFLWKTSSIPEEDLVLNELKYRLRREYDPAGILNPLSTL